MFLLEHHAKALLAKRSIPVPDGAMVTAAASWRLEDLPAGPWMVKAQVAAGGRSKAGAVKPAASPAEIAAIIASLAAAKIANKPVHGFRIERRIPFRHEAYLSLSLDPASCRIRILASAAGGIDVESAASDGGGSHAVLAAPEDLDAAAAEAASFLPPALRAPMRDAAMRLGAAFLAYEAELLEVNPLFVLDDGSWIAGDVKMVIDENAIMRQPAVRELLHAHPALYPESALKLEHGFDYVEVDPEGEIGLITTGAGLSMKLIDELQRGGARPLNFCDIRTGQFRGDPARLIAVMRWIAARPRVGVVLVNVFAGITDLGEFASLFLKASQAVPELAVPVVARLIGRNLDDAKRILAAHRDIAVETDLDRAVERTLAVLAARSAVHG
ncbi:MAG TPA: ATP-grasp domain-containing protein [Stellaceae bacterium]|nr:ATP-grasp domain-containing protein [Stellaceae bacterium]